VQASAKLRKKAEIQVGRELTLIAKLGLGGYLTYRLIRMVDSYRVEIMLTLAQAMGGYVLADELLLSAPLRTVAAGLMVSGTARPFAMSPTTRDHLETFWELVDDIMNVVLFLLLGLQLLVLSLSLSLLTAGLIAIPVVLFALRQRDGGGSNVGALPSESHG